jgi:putative membrane protein
MNRTIARFGLASMLILGTGAAHAQGTPSITHQAAPYDVLFLRHEATGSAYEIAIAQLAQHQATRPDVQAYATTLVNDHQAYSDSLRELAKLKGVTLPDGLTAQARARLKRLAAVHGPGFDSAFLRESIRVNGEDMRSFRSEASRTADPDLRAFVARFLPTEQQHEATARALSNRQGSGGRMPVITPPPAAGANMPVINPPATATAPMPVIRPPGTAK